MLLLLRKEQRWTGPLGSAEQGVKNDRDGNPEQPAANAGAPELHQIAAEAKVEAVRGQAAAVEQRPAALQPPRRDGKAADRQDRKSTRLHSSHSCASRMPA